MKQKDTNTAGIVENVKTDNQSEKENRKLKKQSAKDEKKQRKLNTVAERKRLAEEYKNSLPYKLLTIAKEQKSDVKWYKLDNAALMYPLTASNESNAMFRMSVQLYKPVDPVTLQYALNDVYKRFPTMTGCIKNGVFWPYIDKPYYPIVVSEQKNLPCRPLSMDGKHSQMRITYFNNEISCEIFHSAADGTGAIIFLNSLLCCYFRRLGIDIADMTNCLDHRDIPCKAEIRDNFDKIAVKKNPPPLPPVVKASSFDKATPFIGGEFVTRRGICSATQLKETAKKHDATVTEFLGAVELLALEKLRQATGSDAKHPVRILVPVNLRKIYDVDTLRNHSSYIFYTYHGQTDLDEIIADIKQQVKEQMRDDYFRGMVSYNYNSGNNPLLKIVPLGIKRLAVSAACRRMGDGIVNSATLSNVGVISAPKEFKDHVLRYEFQLGKPARKTVNFAVATYNDYCVICVSNSFAETDAERTFFRILADYGINVAVESDVTEGIQ
ncbi:MAG: hypothetical protein NC350_04920 [Corallococcus sp.]|nr:hypothetical protein [Corallococcus sp.]